MLVMPPEGLSSEMWHSSKARHSGLCPSAGKTDTRGPPRLAGKPVQMHLCAPGPGRDSDSNNKVENVDTCGGTFSHIPLTYTIHTTTHTRPHTHAHPKTKFDTF